jgi:hypothetical protein
MPISELNFFFNLNNFKMFLFLNLPDQQDDDILKSKHVARRNVTRYLLTITKLCWRFGGVLSNVS